MVMGMKRFWFKLNYLSAGDRSDDSGLQIRTAQRRCHAQNRLFGTLPSFVTGANERYHPDKARYNPDNAAQNGQHVTEFNPHCDEDKSGKNKTDQANQLTVIVPQGHVSPPIGIISRQDA
tara:strand:+ start:329 stop:688 length:360 start_codon:yes stop_codon:yes gene_type:complete